MNENFDKLFKGFRFPPEIIPYAIWLYFTFPLSFRDVELLLAQRGVQVSHETIRTWCYRFGPVLAEQLRRKRRKPSDKWHLDEVLVTINRRRYYLWRAVDDQGMVLDILVQNRRNAPAAKRFFQAVLRTTPSRPRVIVTDGLRSYNVISRALLPGVEHRRSKYLNNRAENSHQPTRRRERRLQRFKSPQHAQRFRSIFGIIYDYFHLKKHQIPANRYREKLANRFEIWTHLAV
jgi:putative transposase